MDIYSSIGSAERIMTQCSCWPGSKSALQPACLCLLVACIFPVHGQDIVAVQEPLQGALRSWMLMEAPHPPVCCWSLWAARWRTASLTWLQSPWLPRNRSAVLPMLLKGFKITAEIAQIAPLM